VSTQEPKISLVCDGCGRSVSAEHWRQRIERLQWASRFRPVHIRQLIVCEAPPENPEDGLYFPGGGATWKGPYRSLAEALRDVYGVPAQAGRETLLKTLQRNGVFVTEAVECPVEDAERVPLLAQRERILYDRIRLSYRPRQVLLLTEELSALPQWLLESAIPCRRLPATAEPPAIAAVLRQSFPERAREDAASEKPFPLL
jgi:hypothetical protein